VNVIGFATTNAQIIDNLNKIAMAGGTGQAILVDDSATLSAAIGKIISDSVLVEVCNGVDDNCNGQIDENFPDVGLVCDNGQTGPCFRAGVRVCNADGLGTHCNAPDGSASATAEVCNGLDDNCNGMVDEGLSCTGCVPEICNGKDDDCNGKIDDGNIPGVGDPCGFNIGECTQGTLVCMGAQGLVCVGAKGPTPEVCDGKDNDCDGVIDGITEPCYPEGKTGCTRNGDGSYTCKGICAPGMRSCAGGTIGECVGAVLPAAELCNGVDDDCDGVVDNGFDSGQECSIGVGACHTNGTIVCSADGKSTFCTAPVLHGTIEVCDGKDNDCNGIVDDPSELGSPIGDACGGQGGCGRGVFVCDKSGTIVCTGGGVGTAEVCDGIDNNCNGLIDEAPLPGVGDDCAPPPFTVAGLKGTCKPGKTQCVPTSAGSASIQCVGFVGPTTEICDGLDNDCDGVADNMAICPSATDACVEGQCVEPCRPGEFRCSFGYYCKAVPAGEFCVPDPCADVACPAGFICNRDTKRCEDPCAGVVCGAPRTCVRGRCVDCFDTGCPDGQVCRVQGATSTGACVVDACAKVTCAANEACREGACVKVGCDPACASGEVCVDGACQKSTCDPARCQAITCPIGKACNPSDGQCVADPCAGTVCPGGSQCVVTCGGVSTCQTGAPTTTTVEVLATGGGGCAVGGSGDGGWASGLFGLALLVGRRRRAGRTVRPS
jgi:hypothetical protein